MVLVVLVVLMVLVVLVVLMVLVVLSALPLFILSNDHLCLYAPASSTLFCLSSCDLSRSQLCFDLTTSARR